MQVIAFLAEVNIRVLVGERRLVLKMNGERRCLGLGSGIENHAQHTWEVQTDPRHLYREKTEAQGESLAFLCSPKSIELLGSIQRE